MEAISIAVAFTPRTVAVTSASSRIRITEDVIAIDVLGIGENPLSVSWALTFSAEIGSRDKPFSYAILRITKALWSRRRALSPRLIFSALDGITKMQVLGCTRFLRCILLGLLENKISKGQGSLVEAETILVRVRVRRHDVYEIAYAAPTTRG